MTVMPKPVMWFVSDLHGNTQRYRILFEMLAIEPPDLLVMGGDLFGKGEVQSLAEPLTRLRVTLAERYPVIAVILGNDDLRTHEVELAALEVDGLLHYIHAKALLFRDFVLLGYNYVPPTPFMNKDWERFDVSRFVDVGAVSPLAGYRSVPVDLRQETYKTIREDLEAMRGLTIPERTILVSHAPPYKTNLDRAPLDGKMVNCAPLDVHIGSIAVREWIESVQPLVSLHGHAHESARLTGYWRDQLGRTAAFTAAHDGTELCVVRFAPGNPEAATRALFRDSSKPVVLMEDGKFKVGSSSR